MVYSICSSRHFSFGPFLFYICRLILEYTNDWCLVHQLKFHLFFKFAQDTFVVTSDYSMKLMPIRILSIITCPLVSVTWRPWCVLGSVWIMSIVWHKKVSVRSKSQYIIGHLEKNNIVHNNLNCRKQLENKQIPWVCNTRRYEASGSWWIKYSDKQVGERSELPVLGMDPPEPHGDDAA